MCAADELLGDVAGELDSAAAAADAFGAARDAATGALRSSKSNLQCVTAAFDGGGAISEACGNVTALHTALENIKDYVASTSGGKADGRTMPTLPPRSTPPPTWRPRCA